MAGLAYTATAGSPPKDGPPRCRLAPSSSSAARARSSPPLSALLAATTLAACGLIENLGPGDGGSPDAGANVTAAVTTDAAGGVLVLEGLRFAVPAGALPAGTRLEVVRTSELPVLPDVTPVSPVFAFGPWGTTFETEAFVSFDVTGLAEGAIPVVYWTNAKGEFEPQPCWFADGRVHALATHLRRAFVGASKQAPKTLSCGAGHGQCRFGRCFCLPAQAIASGDLDGAQVLAAEGLEVRSLDGSETSKSSLVVRQTPLRPGALGLASSGPAYDVKGTIGDGARIELCLKASIPEASKGDACLAYFDEERAEWECVDECLQQNDGLICGNTDHFTSFAILLSGNGGKSVECDKEEPYFKNCPRGQLPCADGACHERCLGVCASGEKLCPDGVTCSASPESCPAPSCPRATPHPCPDQRCVATPEECTACGAGLQRCADGACRQACPATSTCGDGQSLCPDGLTCVTEPASCPG